MKSITTFEELYSFMKDLLNGALYDRDMKVFGFNCDCYGNGMSTDTITTCHTKDGISIDIQERGINCITLAFWDTKHTQNDQCFGFEFDINYGNEMCWDHVDELERKLTSFCNKYDDPMYDIEQLTALKHQVGDYEEYGDYEDCEPSPEELDAQLESLEESLKHNPYEELLKNYIHKDDVTPVYCNIISAMVCYMNGEFTKEMLIASIMQSTDNNKDVIEHLETIL